MRCLLTVDKMPLDNALSASLQSWLSHELEARGIDAVIYTRYILSILQQDTFETELGEADFFPPGKKGAASLSNAPGAMSAGRSHQKMQKNRHTERKLSAFTQSMDSEQRKKSAAVECLLSVSDEDSGIEGLVDELYSKIKAQVKKAEQPVAELPADTDSSDSVISTSPEDPAERYYAAFPALGDSSSVAKMVTASEKVACTWPNMVRASPAITKEQKPEASQGKGANQNASPLRREKQKLSATHSHESCLSTSSTRKSSSKNTRVCLPWEDGHQRQEKGSTQFFRCGSQDRAVRKSPKMSRKKSWPDFEKHHRPPFIVPKMVTQSKPMMAAYPSMAECGMKAKPCKISLREIFGTENVPEVIPCKTLVVDGQLVRLCATSVNSNNLERTTKIKLQEAPMEELVALKLQQEFQDMSEKQHAQQSASEEATWYMEPVDQLVSSPEPKVPLFKRNPSEQSLSEADQSGSVMATPICTTLWEDVLDENGVYTGARLSQACLEPAVPPTEKREESEDDNGSTDSDYVDMTVATHLLRDLFDDAPDSDSPEVKADGDDKQNPDVPAEGLNAFGVLLPENTAACDKCGEDNHQELHINPKLNPSDGTHFISQYKGCLMPEITQNKVPDDRPVFYVGEQELNNNNRNQSEHTKVATFEQWPSVDSYNHDLVCNLYPSTHTSVLSTSSVLVPGYSSVWSTHNSQSSLYLHDAAGLAFSAQNKLDLHASQSVFSITCQESWGLPTHRLTMFRHSTAIWENGIWGEMLLVSPPKLWDVNNMKRVSKDMSADVDCLNKCLLNFGLEQKAKSEVEFIEGGLYGGTLNSDDAWSTTRSDCSDDEGICDADMTWNDVISHKNVFQSCSAVELSSWVWNGGGNRLTGSMELLPSETSAFSSEALPPRLPHVQSEPSISQRQLISKCTVKKHRLVQVKHLYKPDTSILKTLGLDSDGEEDYKNDGVEFSPNCHFRPIKTPLNQPSVNQNIVSLGDVYIYSDFIAVDSNKKDEDEETATLTGSLVDCVEEASLMSSSSGSESYQLYHGDETAAVAFVPRFKVFKQHKLIQTGEQEQDITAEMEQGLSERLLVDMKRVLTIEEEEGEEYNDGLKGDLTMKDLDRSLEISNGASSDLSLDSQAADPEPIQSVLSSPAPQTIARLWSDGDRQPDTCDKAEAYDLPARLNAVSSIWSYDAAEKQTQMSTNNLFGQNKEGLQANSRNVATDQWFCGSQLEAMPEKVMMTKQPIKEQHSVNSICTSDQYIPDVLIEVCASVSSNGMTPGSLPDILLHDSIIPSRNPSIDETGIKHQHHIRECVLGDGTQMGHSPDTRGSQTSLSDCSFDLAGNEQNEVGVSTLPSCVGTRHGSSQYDYPDWSTAGVHSLHDSSNEPDPGWLQYDDMVFSDSGDMMFQMDPEYTMDQGIPKSSSHSPLAVADYIRAADPPEVPLSQALYSSDLEKSWLQNNQQSLVQAPQKVARPQTEVNTKPCTFYLEGKCHRADCRFAHDTLQITCRFWEQGECFKGLTCPFLHGHITSSRNSPNQADDKTKYNLDSKKEFPELSQAQSRHVSKRYWHEPGDMMQEPVVQDGEPRNPSNSTHHHGNTISTMAGLTEHEPVSDGRPSQLFVAQPKMKPFVNHFTCKIDY